MTDKTKDAKQELYDRQVVLLRTFLEKGAITKAQFTKSYTDLTAKMFPGGSCKAD